MTEQGPEPTGWELLRAIRDLKTDLQQVGDKVVPLAVYQSDQKGNDERHARTEARVKGLESTMAEADKLKRQQRLTVSLAIAAPILSFVVGLLGRGWFPS